MLNTIASIVETSITKTASNTMPIAPSCTKKTAITILGATGSVGQSALQVIAQNTKAYEVYAISGHKNLPKLLQICQKFLPKKVVCAPEFVPTMRTMLADSQLDDIEVLGGQDALCNLAKDKQTDVVVAAIVGAAGLLSTHAAVQAGKKILLANKESMVMAGALLMSKAKQTGATILPIDSEHNAIFQCLPWAVQCDMANISNSAHGIKTLWLTASGGRYLHASIHDMQNATPKDAMHHPNWQMGAKISVDSSTMMNKGLELIEAVHLFGVCAKRIKVAIHPQSIVHSMVEYIDGSMIAHMAHPDMKTPIAHALGYPKRINSGTPFLDLFRLQNLSFIEPDLQKFECLSLAMQAASYGDGACIILNAANEVAVQAFLDEKIALTDIAHVIQRTLKNASLQPTLSQSFSSIDAILAQDSLAKDIAKIMVQDISTQSLNIQ